MDEAARLLTFLTLTGAGFAAVGGAVAWFFDETRRLRRTLIRALGGEPQPILIARGRGAGIGFDLSGGQVAIAWDAGGWRLTYRLDELIGVELIVDRRVVARASRGETRRPLDDLADPQERVRLRFLFDDAHHPDFELDLWTPDDEGRRGRPAPDEALYEANRWVARIEALLRRPMATRPVAVATAAIAPPLPAATGEAPPWEEDQELIDDMDELR